jgi:hypothetical protein
VKRKAIEGRRRARTEDEDENEEEDEKSPPPDVGGYSCLQFVL